MKTEKTWWRTTLLRSTFLMLTLLILIGFAQGEPSTPGAAIPDQDPALALTDAENASLMEGNSTNATAEDPALGNNTTAASFEGIWLVSLGQSRTTMVLHQRQDVIFGSASSDQPQPWNAAVLGSASGQSIDLTLTRLDASGPVTTRLVGRSSQEAIEGDYFRTDALGKVDNGAFTAFLINPDTSGYTPVQETALPAAETSTAASAIPETAPVAPNQTESVQPAARSGYTDVHDLAHLVPPAAGVIPPGINMGGGGGMGMG
ncbi:MAG: hypothetical protein GKC10_04600 [Methanosarcinales archaeon]|nr:hypothetical protein [Methanosarcinales archaeon]